MKQAPKQKPANTRAERLASRRERLGSRWVPLSRAAMSDSPAPPKLARTIHNLRIKP